MTRETYAKAGEIISRIEIKESQLGSVLKWLKRTDDYPFCRIKTDKGVLVNLSISPNASEVKTMLILMKERLENEIKKLEKELEELK